MPNFTANKNIAFQGELIKKGSEIELTAAQAKVMGKKVSEVKTTKPKTEA